MIRFLIKSYLIGVALICLNIIVISPSLAADQVTNLTSTSHQLGERSNNNEITVTWDASGINNLAGFAYEWSNDPDTTPVKKKLDSNANTVTSSPLPDGTWYFHIRPVLTVSPFYGKTSHLGPFYIVTAPVADDWTPKPPTPGDSVTLSGLNLKQGLQIYFYTDPEMTNLKARVTDVFVIVGDEKHVSFTVPQDLAPGTYYLKLKNTDGKTGQVVGFEVESAKVLDVDHSGEYNYLDRLYLLRGLFNVSPVVPTTPVDYRDKLPVGENEDTIKNRITSLKTQILDVDHSGEYNYLDRLYLLRGLFNVSPVVPTTPVDYRDKLPAGENEDTIKNQINSLK